MLNFSTRIRIVFSKNENLWRKNPEFSEIIYYLKIKIKIKWINYLKNICRSCQGTTIVGRSTWIQQMKENHQFAVVGALVSSFFTRRIDVNHQICGETETNDAELSRGVRTQELGEEWLSPPPTTTLLLLLLF